MALFRRKRKKSAHTELNKRLLNLIALNVFLFFSILLWIDFLGLINIEEDLYPTLEKIPLLSGLVAKRADDPFLLTREERRKEAIKREVEWRKIKQYEKKLELKEKEIDGKAKSLEEYEKRLNEKEKEIDNKYKENETYKQKIMLQAKYFVSMPPADAVKRLEKLDDLLVIDIFKEIEKEASEAGKQSLVPYLLKLMDPDRAATIQRKMTVVEEDVQNFESTNY